MKAIKKLLALLLTLFVFLQTVNCGPIVKADSKQITRDTILLLDCSGSMDGTPLDAMKVAATKFCNAITSASGTNRVAIISYSDDSTVVSDFTDDVKTLQQDIDGINSLFSTNTQSAISAADTMMKQKSTAAIKNIVLMTDGLPNEGEYSESGLYNSSDYDFYGYANAVDNLYNSLKGDYYFYTLGFFHNLYGNELTFGRKFLNNIQNAGYYEVTDPNQLSYTFGQIGNSITKVKKTGTFKYQSGDSTDYSSTYYYDDDYFNNSSYTYNPSLGTMSLCLAMSAFASNEADYPNKSKNMQELLSDIGFDNFDKNHDFTIKPTMDSIGVAAASKQIQDSDGNQYTLIVTAIRGSGYGAEWSSNFTLGSTGEHEGFSDAKNQVISFLNSYTSKYNITGKVKLWITGYSRAAATSNLVAGALDNGSSIGSQVSLDSKDLFAYCFETPAGSLKNITSNKSLYQNIFNIINPSDPVPKVAPSVYGFSRYGTDKILPAAENDSKYNTDVSKMLKIYKSLGSTSSYQVDDFKPKKFNLLPPGISDDNNNHITQGTFLDDFINKLAKEKIKSRSDYVNTYQNDFRQAAGISLGTDNSQWDNFKTILNGKLSSNAVEIFLMYGNPITRYLTYDYVENLVVQSLNEAKITNYSQSQINSMVSTLISLAISFCISYPDTTATLVKNIQGIGGAHFPELCLAWMQSMDPNYTTNAGQTFSSGSYRVIHINCPVDVDVYDSNNSLVAQIKSEQANEIANSSIISEINEDGEKLIYLPTDAGYTVKMTARDNCSIDYAVSEYSIQAGDITHITNYFDVPVGQGMTLTGVAPAFSDSDQSGSILNGSSAKYALLDSQGKTLSPSNELKGDAAEQAYFTVDVASENSNFGTVTGGGIRQYGNYAEVKAIPKNGYTFVGWYENDQMISNEADYRFRVTKDTSIKAVFSASSSNSPSTLNPNTSSSETKLPTETGKIKNPSTGNAETGLFGCLFIVPACILTIYITRRKKK